VKWENTTNEEVLERPAPRSALVARGLRAEQGPPAGRRAVQPRQAAGLHDPFAGGGAIPLEAQRLGLEAYASDLNPVAVTHQQGDDRDPAPKFAGRAPVGPPLQSG
jgi:putative DNA methylase